ncbi:arginine-binding extracellular protein ArtP-like [Elysia marginata]|uniref:Arginine-binding extracellular protein ArtP-like n=1 Tax=Elysia marginata TaxID=1093978 RepID=A0AAV4JRZ0_9GAST|nr:arginine-binding extracellular protein ArtP-like [Elysia marginata]
MRHLAGLMSGWFDACPGYVISVDRKTAFDFTDPYLYTDASFTVAPGNPSGFNPDISDFSQFTFAHLTGAVTNEKCLDRLNKKAKNFVVAANLPDARAMLLNGTADVLFSPRHKIDGLEILPQRVHCDAGGSAVMLKRGSALAQWWNPAFQTLKQSGEYQTLCQISSIKYNGTVDCLPATTNLPESSRGSLTSEKANDLPSDKVWLFAVDGRKRPYSFFDDKGELVGFDVDLITRVCALSQRQCEIVLAEFTECIFSEREITFAGRGLMAPWFDACPGYAISLDREGAFDFTDPYLYTDSSFTVAPSNPSGFDPTTSDFSQFNFVHLTGALTNEKCLNRLNKTAKSILVAANLPDAKAALLNGTMLRLTGEYQALCLSSQIKYNATIPCLLTSQVHSLKPKSSLNFEAVDTKVWLFSVSGSRKPFNYVDEQGQLTGFDVDFVQKVCQLAGQSCTSVLTPFTECTFTNRNIVYAGRGLMNGWVDACTGYADTLDRDSAFDFTDAYFPGGDAHFFVAPGNPSGFDPSLQDYTSFTFVQLTGAPTNAKCLGRLGKKFDKILIAANLPEAKGLLLSGQADVLFAPRSNIDDLQTLPEGARCDRTGTAVMVKKGSTLPTWWNPAFRLFQQTGQFQQFCEASSLKYNYTITCPTPP